MSYINEEELSPLLQNLLADAGAAISGEVHLQVDDNLMFDVNLQTVVQDNGNYVLHVKPESLQDEYAISHELLHICAKSKIPGFVRVIEPNLIGMIGTELQGYLEHNWIVAEQRRRGLEFDEFHLFADLETKVGTEDHVLEKNVNRIFTINNLLRTFPDVFARYRSFFEENCPNTLAISQRIMVNFPAKEIYSNYEARKAVVGAIKEWTKVVQEYGFKSVNLSLLLSVTPVFSANQMQRLTNVILGFTPKDIVNNKTKAASHILYTLSDNQCCVVFSIDENGVKTIQNYMNHMTLEEFLKMAKIPYLMR